MVKDIIDAMDIEQTSNGSISQNIPKSKIEDYIKKNYKNYDLLTPAVIGYMKRIGLNISVTSSSNQSKEYGITNILLKVAQKIRNANKPLSSQSPRKNF